MVLWHTPEAVGVGCPNPLGEETKPLQWMTHRKLCSIQPQRGDMFIARRHALVTKAPEGRQVRFVSITDSTD